MLWTHLSSPPEGTWGAPGPDHRGLRGRPSDGNACGLSHLSDFIFPHPKDHRRRSARAAEQPLKGVWVLPGARPSTAHSRGRRSPAPPPSCQQRPLAAPRVEKAPRHPAWLSVHPGWTGCRLPSAGAGSAPTPALPPSGPAGLSSPPAPGPGHSAGPRTPGSLRRGHRPLLGRVCHPAAHEGRSWEPPEKTPVEEATGPCEC